MANARRHLRYDVEVPIFFETVDAQGKNLHAERREIISTEQDAQLTDVNSEIEFLFQTVFNQNSEAAMIFHMLNHRLDYFSWLLEGLIQGEDLTAKHDYKFRKREDAKRHAPAVKDDSIVGGLIAGIYVRINHYIDSLVSTIENSVDGKIFIFDMDLMIPFSEKDYVRNLDELVSRKIAPAQILSLLIHKLNIYEAVDSKLRMAYRGISDPAAWPLEKVNLSAGGFSSLTNQQYPHLSHLNVFLKLDEEIIVCRGKVVFNKALAEEAEFDYRVAVEFEFLSGDYIRFISEYVQKQELQEAMKAFPNIV